MLRAYLEPGIHKTNIIVYSITYDGNKFDRPSLPFEITYDIPRLDNIVFGKSLVQKYRIHLMRKVNFIIELSFRLT